jgi:iron uptake system component EfeO
MSAPSTSTPEGRPQSGLVRLALAGAILLVVLGGAAFYYASTLRSGTETGDGAIRVTIRSDSCDPNELTVPAGTASFEIANASDRAVEWEILDGVMVVEERENIAPGFNQLLTAKLRPGDYAITCGLLSNPRGTLHVTPSEAATAEAAAQPSITAFIGPLAEYKVFLTLKAKAFVKAAGALADAVKAGDVDAAKALYPAARAAYAEIEPEAARFADLHNSIDGLADYLEKREADPAFTGLHRIEFALFSQNSTDDLAPIADKLVADAASLQQRLQDAKTQPADLADNAQRLATAVAAAIAAGEDHYANTDLAAFAANLDSMRKIASLLGPVAPSGSKDLVAGLDADVAALAAKFDALKQGDAYASYADVSADARKDLAAGFTAIAGKLGALNAALGLS